MKTLTTRTAWRSALSDAHRSGKTVGFVPTMGALHAGHESLIRTARQECDVVAASIFVNPLQFGNSQDLTTYPRTEADDQALLEAIGCDVLFIPPIEEIYRHAPDPLSVSVSVGEIAERFEGADRPGHFEGMATVVAILFGLTGPCRAYFGEKDFQQLCVVRQMVEDLAFDVTVVGCPTIRESDGLALSSRNRRLSKSARETATVFWRALAAGNDAATRGANPQEIEQAMRDVIGAEPDVLLSYAAVVESAKMEQVDVLYPLADYRLVIAGVIDGVRLLDNAPLRGFGHEPI